MKVIEPLRELQDVDSQIRNLDREVKDIPKRIAQERARLAGVNASLEIAKSQLAAMEKRIKDAMDEAAELRARAHELQIAQATAKSNRELQQSIMQVENLERDAKASDDRALMLTEDQLPPMKKRVEEAQERVDGDNGQVEGYVQELSARLARAKEDLEKCRAERLEKEAAVRDVDASALLYYERISTRCWPALAYLNSGDACEGCHMKQPPYVAQSVEHNAKVEKGQLTRCTMCGRILYR